MNELQKDMFRRIKAVMINKLQNDSPLYEYDTFTDEEVEAEDVARRELRKILLSMKP
jgi:hypothetical protein